jgi:hypothetical protein
MEQVLDVYKRPYDADFPVVCMDESPEQLIETVREEKYEAFYPAEARRLINRFEFVFTPKHGSWLNMAEIELHTLNTQCLKRNIATIDEMKCEVEAWQNSRNNQPAKINWQFTTTDARVKVKKLYQSFKS